MINTQEEKLKGWHGCKSRLKVNQEHSKILPVIPVRDDSGVRVSQEQNTSTPKTSDVVHSPFGRFPGSNLVDMPQNPVMRFHQKTGTVRVRRRQNCCGNTTFLIGKIVASCSV